MSRPRRLATARRFLCAVVALALVSGCTPTFGLHDRQWIGRKVPYRVSLAVDESIRPALAETVDLFNADIGISVLVNSGTSIAIAHAVKDGDPIDVIVVNVRRALWLVRDEVMAPARVLGVYQGVTYWVVPVTDIGRRFARWIRRSDARESMLLNEIQPPAGIQ